MLQLLLQPPPTLKPLLLPLAAATAATRAAAAHTQTRRQRGDVWGQGAFLEISWSQGARLHVFRFVCGCMFGFCLACAAVAPLLTLVMGPSVGAGPACWPLSPSSKVP